MPWMAKLLDTGEMTEMGDSKCLEWINCLIQVEWLKWVIQNKPEMAKMLGVTEIRGL